MAKKDVYSDKFARARDNLRYQQNSYFKTRDVSVTARIRADAARKRTRDAALEIVKLCRRYFANRLRRTRAYVEEVNGCGYVANHSVNALSPWFRATIRIPSPYRVVIQVEQVFKTWDQFTDWADRQIAGIKAYLRVLEGGE